MQSGTFSPDKRLIERQIKRRFLTREQYRAYLDALQDATEKGISMADAEREEASAKQATDVSEDGRDG